MAMTENDKIAKYGPIVSFVGSMSHKDKKPYEIRCKDGIHTCNCGGFPFSKEIPKSCKHIRFYLGDKAQRATVAVESRIVTSLLTAAGLIGKLKDLLGAAGYNRAVEMMATHLKPHLGVNPQPIANVGADDDVRLLMLDD